MAEAFKTWQCGTCGFIYDEAVGLPDEGFPGDAWHTQDLTANYGAPTASSAGASPVALVHMGYTSVDLLWHSVERCATECHVVYGWKI